MFSSFSVLSLHESFFLDTLSHCEDWQDKARSAVAGFLNPSHNPTIVTSQMPWLVFARIPPIQPAQLLLLHPWESSSADQCDHGSWTCEGQAHQTPQPHREVCWTSLHPSRQQVQKWNFTKLKTSSSTFFRSKIYLWHFWLVSIRRHRQEDNSFVARATTGFMTTGNTGNLPGCVEGDSSPNRPFQSWCLLG